MCTTPEGAGAPGAPDATGAGGASTTFRVYNAGSIGAAIRELRTRRGLTQEQFARQVGIPVRYVSTLEQGHATEQLERLLRVLVELDARLVIQEGAPW